MAPSSASTIRNSPGWGNTRGGDRENALC
jgi:hypothetical protein